MPDPEARRPDGAEPEGVTERVTERLADAADAAVDAAAGLAVGVAGRLMATAQRLRAETSESARRRRARRRPLPNLFDLHPEARTAPRRSLGLMTVPVAEIRGTAVQGPAQRGGDFLPLPGLRTGNWRARWQRLREAQERLAVLPPIDLLQTGDGYWVEDGHNRVAAALYGGQDDIDAVVTHVHLAGDEEPGAGSGSIAAGLPEAGDLRAAGTGRLSRGSSVRSGRPRGHGAGPPAPDR